MNFYRQMILYFSEFLSSLSYTIIASFYPGIAASKGIPVWLIGFIFSIDPIIGIPTSLLLGKYMNIIGRKCVLTFGMILGSFSLVVIDFVESSSDDAALILSIFSRILAGIGAGCAMTAGPAILISENPDQVDKVIGYFEAASGMGLMLGPLLGSLFDILGIFSSVMFTASIYFFVSFFTFFCLGPLTAQDIRRSGSLPWAEFLSKPVMI